MNEQYKARTLPKKTKIIFIILIILAIFTYFMQLNSKKIEAKRILVALGYNNIVNLNVYNKTKVEDKITKIQGYKYFVKFKDIDKNNYCKGYILKDFKKAVFQDIDCKKGQDGFKK